MFFINTNYLFCAGRVHLFKNFLIHIIFVLFLNPQGEGESQQLDNIYSTY